MRAQGRPGACCTRGLACQCTRQKATHEHTGQLEHSGLPCAMVLRLTSCSSRRTAFLPPSPLRSLLPKNLTPAPRRPNHTTSPYASRTLACARFASIASHRAFVTMASAPQLGETGGVMELIWPAAEAEYFCANGWTGFD